MVRVIARLDVKGENVIKGVHLEGLRIVGKPDELAYKYKQEGIDEIYYVDSVASLYGRNHLHHVVKQAARQLNIPITVEGGVKDLEDISQLLNAGADKVAINTFATKEPDFLRTAAKAFGSQCIVLSIAAKKVGDKKWVAWTDNAREPTMLDVYTWAQQAADLGVGEIVLTSIDNEGTASGFDIELYRELSRILKIPVIASGGAGSIQDILNLVKETDISAVACAHVLHYEKVKIPDIKQALMDENIATIRVVENKSSSHLRFKHHKEVGVIDFGAGNLFNLVNVLEHLNLDVSVISHANEMKQLNHLILPGVGSFGPAMQKLSERNLIDPIVEHAKRGDPLLGICLGAQLLFDSSHEFGQHKGLGLIPGSVIPIQCDMLKGRVPNIGWHDLKLMRENPLILEDAVKSKSKYYFVHSFKMMPNKKEAVYLELDYFGDVICAIAGRDNIFGVQFHPERSGDAGLEILFNFLSL